LRGSQQGDENPVVASAMISKAHVFGVATRRNESDVLLDPDFLHDVKSETYKPTRKPA
jgi:hypothetical protein